MGGRNGQKAKMAREKNIEENKAPKCMISCLFTFLKLGVVLSSTV